MTMSTAQHCYICADVPRFAPRYRTDFLKYSVSLISDAVSKYGSLKSYIMPIRRGMRFCGRLLTVQCEPGDAKAVSKALETTGCGDVLAICAGGGTDLAALDESFIPEILERGLSGVVVDGVVRGLSAWLACGLPVFARGSSLRILSIEESFRVNAPAPCAGIILYPGDLIAGDDDGVITVPAHDLERVLSLTETQFGKEEWIQQQLNAGVTMNNLFDCDAKIAKWHA